MKGLNSRRFWYVYIKSGKAVTEAYDFFLEL